MPWPLEIPPARTGKCQRRLGLERTDGARHTDPRVVARAATAKVGRARSLDQKPNMPAKSPIRCNLPRCADVGIDDRRAAAQIVRREAKISGKRPARQSRIDLDILVVAIAAVTVCEKVADDARIERDASRHPRCVAGIGSGAQKPRPALSRQDRGSRSSGIGAVLAVVRDIHRRDRSAIAQRTPAKPLIALYGYASADLSCNPERRKHSCNRNRGTDEQAFNWRPDARAASSGRRCHSVRLPGLTLRAHQ